MPGSRRELRVGLVAVVAMATLFGSAASAAEGDLNGTIDSGGKIKYFETQRVPTQQVRIKLVRAGDAKIRYRLYNCANFNFNANEGPEHTSNEANFVNQPYAGNQICFRVSARRTNPANTNGPLPGSGTTTFEGRIQW
ncbi:MAG TPA: hypothetical protein VK906_17360 [Egicoccus sp.]|nr:hypothetical protein [Egicoccus sp.]HSK24957.1 hypothetical protein [Egicoccus sp.]